MTPVTSEPPTQPTASGASTSSASSSPLVANPPAPMESTEKEDEEKVEEAAAEVKGDPEVAPNYVRHLLPVFTEVFHVSMLSSVRYFIFVYSMIVVQCMESSDGKSFHFKYSKNFVK